MKNKKILILVPAISARGGISNYYQVLKTAFSDRVEYFERGARNWPYRAGNLFEALRAVRDLLRFCVKLASLNYGIVQTTTSLGSLAVVRDGLFIFFGKLFGCNVIVFFRGWDERFEKKIETKFFRFFKAIFFKADAMIVLSSTFKSKLLSWGYPKAIHVETTIVDQTLLDAVNEEDIVDKYADIDPLIILFLARVEIPKGIYEAIDTFTLLRKEYRHIRLVIAGDGFELEPAKKYVSDREAHDITFLGEVHGEEKIRAFWGSHIYFFPSYHEGMPNSVLEAMAFGLPVIARPVGGLVDILKDNITGFCTLFKTPEDFAVLFKKLIDNKSLMMEIGINNYRMARTAFSPADIVNRLENIFKQVGK
jgi:glycosyltransferase involved in cell wall biosynthesis